VIGVIEVCKKISLVPSCMKYAPRMTRKMVLKDNSKRKDLKKGLYSGFSRIQALTVVR